MIILGTTNERKYLIESFFHFSTSQIHLHRTSDMEEFYKIVPIECLPSEYGGPLESPEISSSNEYTNNSYLYLLNGKIIDEQNYIKTSILLQENFKTN